MGALLADRVKETTTTTGTGTVNLGGAATGFVTFVAAVGDAAKVYYTISGGSEWEVGIGTVTDASPDTLARNTILASSNAGSAVNFSAGTKDVFLTAPAAILTPDATVANGRITTESGVPVSTSDRSAQSTIYYTPYNGNRIALFDGHGWRIHTFTERSLALSGLTSGKNYDVFLYNNSGTLTLELSAAWTNDTTRADALTTQDGITVKSGSTTRRWLGTIRTTGTTTTQDSGGGSTTQVGGKRFVWNAYNQVPRFSRVHDTTDNWAYTTATIRVANGATAPLNCVEYVTGDAATLVVGSSQSAAFLQNNSTNNAISGIGVDSTSAFSGYVGNGFNANATQGSTCSFPGRYVGYPGLGYHFLAWLEKGGDNNCTFLGDNGGDGTQMGMVAMFLG